MNAPPSGRTWEDASSPAAVRLTRQYEEAWHQAERTGSHLDPRDFSSAAGRSSDLEGARLAILRTDLSLRWESGDHTGARWYIDRFRDLGSDTLVALAYEEYCLREEDGEDLPAGGLPAPIPVA